MACLAVALLPVFIVVTGGLREPHPSRGHERGAAFLAEEAQASTGLSMKIQHEIQEAEHRINHLLRGHPHERKHLGRILRLAAKMARRAGDSQTMARHAHAEFAALAMRERQLLGRAGGSAFAGGDSQSALLGYANGLANAAEADKKIAAEMGLTERMVERLIGGAEGHRAAKLLGQAQRAGHMVAASEAREARDAVLGMRGERRQQAATNDSGHGALNNFSSGLSDVASADLHLLAETEAAEGAVRRTLGAKGARAEQALEQAEAAQRRVLASEGRELKEARHELREFKGRSSAPLSMTAAASRIDRDERHQRHAKLRQIRQVMERHLRLSKREKRLAKRTRAFARHMAALGREAEVALKAGDREDAEAAGDLGRQVARFEATFKSLTAMHRRLAGEAEQRAVALRGVERRLHDQWRQLASQQEPLPEAAGAGASTHTAVRAAAGELLGSRKILAETQEAEAVVRREIRGGGEAAEVRAYVTKALKRAERAEEHAVGSAAQLLRRAMPRQ